MRFSPEHFNSLKNAIALTLNDLCNTDTLKSANIADCLIKYEFLPISKTRLMWDLFWLSKWSKANRDACDLYNDTHIETAIRQALNDIRVGKVSIETVEP